MKEVLQLRPEGEGIIARHRFRVFGLPFVELRYEITPRPKRVEAVVPAEIETGAEDRLR